MHILHFGSIQEAARMGPNTNPDHKSSMHGLKVLIAGAGIGGLAAAIALRQQGHHVEVMYAISVAVCVSYV